MPSVTPMMPPIMQRMTLSVMNCMRMAEPGGAQGLAGADLPGALGDRDHHDVHDADAAHQQ